MLRVFDVGDMNDHIGYAIAENELDAIDSIDYQGNAENLMAIDIEEQGLTKDEIKDIILHELNEDEETTKELLKNYEIDTEVKDVEEEKYVDPDKIDKDFHEFVEVCYDTTPTLFQKGINHLHYIFYVPGDYQREQFNEDMQEFCDRYDGMSYELINQTPNSPSPQFFSKNTKLMFPNVKDFETLAKQPDKLKDAIRWFKDLWGATPNLEDEDDQEDLVLIYNEQMEENRKWKPVQVNLLFEAEEEQEESNKEE